MKIAKRALALIFVLILSINSFGAIVSDNDGSAFVTKAEFDAMKNSFDRQIGAYQDSLNAKIDGAIAGYLAGIKISNTKKIDFIYDTLKCGDALIKDVKWTKSNSWTLRAPKGTGTDSLDGKDYCLMDYDFTHMRGNGVRSQKRYYVSNYDWPMRFIVEKASQRIMGWGKYNYRWYLWYMEYNQDRPNGSSTTNTLGGERVWSYQVSIIWNALKNVGRVGTPYKSMSIGNLNGNTYQDQIYNYFLYTKENYNESTDASVVRFAPLSTYCECVITNKDTDMPTFAQDVDYTTANKGSTANYKNGGDSYWTEANREMTVSNFALSNQRQDMAETPSNGEVRLEYDCAAQWFTNYAHNGLKWDCLVSGGGTQANAAIKCGMLYGKITDKGTLTIRTISPTSGKIIYYIGTAPSATWNGKINTYTTDATCTVVPNVANIQTYEIEDEDQFLYLVWLPDTDAPLPYIDARIVVLD